MNCEEHFHCILGCIGEGALYERAVANNIECVVFKDSILKIGDIIDYVKKNKINIINFHGAKPFLMNRFIKNKIDIPSVATVHSNYKQDFLNNRLKYILFTPLSIFGLKSFDNYICVSDYIKSLMDNDGFSGQKFVVRNGIDLTKVNVKISKKEIRKQYGLSENDFVYVCVARLHPVKNHKELLKGFKMLTDVYNNVYVMLVGEGQEKIKLKELCSKLNINNKVIFVGFKENVADFINAADISILTSVSEGGAPPIAILESGAVRKTIISTIVGDIDKILNENEGYLVSGFSGETIFQKMKIAYEQREKLDFKGRLFYNNISSNFSINNFVNNYFEAYKVIKLKSKRET